MIKTAIAGAVALLALVPAGSAERFPVPLQARGVRDLIADLGAGDAAARARAACELREMGDTAADALTSPADGGVLSAFPK